MTFTKETINALQKLRKCFKEENLGTLKLSSPQISDEIILMAVQSKTRSTQALSLDVLRQMGINKNKVLVNGTLINIASWDINHPQSPTELQSDLTIPKKSKSKRIYRGREVA